MGGLLKNFDNEGFEFFLSEESLSALIVFVEIDFEFVPNGVDEGDLFGGDVSGGFDFEATAVQIDTVSEVFPDEVEVLLEGDEPIVVSVQLLEYIYQILSGWLNLNEEAEFSKQLNESLKINFNGFPVSLVSIFSLEDDFSEIDGQNEGNKFFESY